MALQMFKFWKIISLSAIGYLYAKTHRGKNTGLCRIEWVTEFQFAIPKVMDAPGFDA